MTTQQKPILTKRSVKHVFTPPEVATLNIDFGQAFDAVKAAEADFDSVKAVHKSKITEAEARMTTLRATINAGFEMRVKECVIVFRPTDKKKDFYLQVDLFEGEIPENTAPLFTEDMTQEDFEQDLIAADSAFENRTDIHLWSVENDNGKIVVGQQKNRWFAALRCNVGAHKIEERLDGEQRSVKKRFDAITLAAKRVSEWLKANLGKESTKGFDEAISKAIEGEKEKAE